MRSPRVRWVYSGIRVQDLSRSVRFYRRVGFRVGRRGRMQHGGQFVDLRFPGTPHTIELNFYPTTNRYYEPFIAGTEFDHFGFEVDDVTAWAQHLHRARIPLVLDFTEGVQRLIYIRDPDGNWLEFCGPAAAKGNSRRGHA
jgi:catechol 2,3-dioxygenase-like lactoylglutathione lyase family enzyme